MREIYAQLVAYLERSSDSPGALLLVAVLVFAVLASALLAVYYIIRCSVMARTELRGFLEVRMELNRGCGEDFPLLNMGCFRIGLEDSAARGESRADPGELFFPRLNLQEKGEWRTIRVGTILRRYEYEYAAAGLKEDGSGKLLRLLSRDSNFCSSLGELRYDPAKGLVSSERDGVERDNNDPRTIHITASLPPQYASQISADAAEQLKNICLTIRYV